MFMQKENINKLDQGKINVFNSDRYFDESNSTIEENLFYCCSIFISLYLFYNNNKEGFLFLIIKEGFL